MRNGTHFNKLTLINSGQDDADDASVHYPYQPSGEISVLADAGHQTKTTFLVFVTISVACATAAVATGTYAIWLSRHLAARQVLTDVNDILQSCQARMRQLEADVQRLPNRQA